MRIAAHVFCRVSLGHFRTTTICCGCATISSRLVLLELDLTCPRVSPGKRGVGARLVPFCHHVTAAVDLPVLYRTARSEKR